MTYTETVHIDEEGHRTVVHVPVRTPEEFAAWYANLDRIIRTTFPGWRLKPLEETYPQYPQTEMEAETEMEADNLAAVPAAAS